MDNQKLSEKIDYTKELFGESILADPFYFSDEGMSF